MLDLNCPSFEIRLTKQSSAVRKRGTIETMRARTGKHEQMCRMLAFHIWTNESLLLFTVVL